MTVQEAKERLIEKLCHEKEPHKFCRDACMYGDEHCEVQVAIKCMEEVEQYRALGTVEELKEAKKLLEKLEELKFANEQSLPEPYKKEGAENDS